jgi:hypothetical protein
MEGRHVGVREHGPDDRLSFRHDLFRRPVVDTQRSEVDLVEPDPLEPFRPRLHEPVPGLGAVPDNGEAPGRAAEQQHLPLGIGQLLSLVHHDVRERASEPVRVGARQRGLVDQGLLEILAAIAAKCCSSSAISAGSALAASQSGRSNALVVTGFTASAPSRQGSADRVEQQRRGHRRPARIVRRQQHTHVVTLIP